MNRPKSTQNSVNRLIWINIVIVQSILMGFYKCRAHKAAASLAISGFTNFPYALILVLDSYLLSRVYTNDKPLPIPCPL